MKTKNMARLLTVFAVFFCLLAVTSVAVELKPGLNVLTGTAAVYDFEGDNSNVVFDSAQGTDANGKVTNAVVVREKGDDTDNKAAAVRGNGGYFYIDIDYPVIEKTRPIKVTFDYILGIGGSQVRYLVNYPVGLAKEAATFQIYLHSAQTEEVWRSASFEKSSEKEYLYSNGVTYYPGGHDIKSHAWINYSVKAQVSYFDNLSVIPYYAVKFDLNGGIGVADNEYFLQDAGTTYTIKNNSSSIMRPGYTFAGWAKTANATADDVVTSVTVEEGKDIKLYAIWVENPADTKKSIELFDGETLRTFYAVEAGKNQTLPEYETNNNTLLEGWQTADGNTIYGFNIPVVSDHLKLYSVWEEMETKPGINAFENGDFEKDGLVDVRPSNGKVSIVTDTDGNRMAEYERGNGYASIQHYVKWEHGRKYRIGYRVKSEYVAGSCTNIRFAYIAKDENDEDITKYDHIINQSTPKANEWFSYSTDYTYNNESHIEDIKNSISIYYNPNSENKGGTIYYDDLVLIPYYKVSYNAGGGTGAPADEYFLADKYTVSSEVPVRPGFRFMGWSLKNGSVTAVTEVVPTPGEDITLYAIWEDVATDTAIVYDMTSEVPGVANGSISVICPEEVASYTNIEVYLADNDGIMAGFTPFATMTITDGMAAYAVTGNRAFAEGATRLAFVFKADGLDDITYWITIPEEHRFNPADHELKYSFWAVSDSHLGGVSYNSDYWKEMTFNRNNAVKDIYASDADFMFINGDVANYGTEPFAKVVRAYLDDILNNTDHNVNNIPVFLVNGNHEYMNTDNANGGFDFDPIQKPFYEQIDYIKENYPDVKITHDGESIWFAADIMGAKFIFLSSPEETAEGNKHTYTMSDGQLEFLEEQLFEGEYSNKTTFIVTHVPLEETYKQDGKYEDGITNSEAVREILARHPNTVFCTGHTHSELGYEGAHFVGVGDMTSTFSHLNDGCMVWISAYDKVGEDNGGHIKSYSTGMYIEVYNDMIIVKSRKFLENSVYFGHATYMIPTQDSNVEVARADISGGNPADGVVLSADIANPEDYTYEWIVAGEVVSEESTWTIDAKIEFAGEYVYLRAIDENGYYATAKSAQPFTAATVTYDANGGSGAPAAEKAFAGEYTVNNSVFPKKDGGFFIGWATSADATKLVERVNVTEDITLYAVYTDEPKFYFDANNSGFVPNGVATTATVVDGNLVTIAESGDQYYTWSNGSFAAADYPYMRIKLAKQTAETELDGVFFKSDAGGFAEARHIMFHMASEAVSLSDGYDIYEFDILNIPEEGDSWYGTISSLRYDALALSGGSTKTDYIVFSDKKGIYKADVALENGVTTATLSSDSVNVSVESVSWNENTATIVLKPAEGYEFTTVEDVLEIVTVNGEKVQGAVIDENGKAVITYAFELVVVIGNPDSDTEPMLFEFDEKIGASTVIVAVYDAENRFIAAYVEKLDSVSNISVYIDNSLGVKYVKAFAFDRNGNMNPLTKEICQKFKNERIVKLSGIERDDNGDYYMVYELFNPYTGATSYDVPGSYRAADIESISDKWTAGDIVFLKDGKVPDEADDNKLGTIVCENDELWWVLDCNTEENYIEVIKVPSVSSNDDLVAAVENSTVYKVGVSDADVTIIGHQFASLDINMVRWGSLKVADVAKLDGSDKSYLAVNNKYEENGSFKSVYSSYVKIYLDADWVSKSDLTAVNSDGFNAEANFIMVIANNDEDINLCVLE